MSPKSQGGTRAMNQPPFRAFLDNALEVIELLNLHQEMNEDRQTHHKFEILAKSCIVLVVACWEVFVEDTAAQATDFLVRKAGSPAQLPKDLQKFVAADLRADKHELRVWDLAGEGWKDVVIRHQRAMLTKHLGPFNTPRTENIDKLFDSVLGIQQLSQTWSWKGMPRERAKQILSDIVTLRGSIAHRLKASNKVTWALADRYSGHLLYLAIKTSNAVRSHVQSVVGEFPWDEESYRSIK
jgi:hypothetical protein